MFDWEPTTGELYWETTACSRSSSGPATQFDPLHAHELFHPDDAQAMDAAKEAHFSGRAALFEVEHRMRHSSGGYRTVLTRGRALRSPQGTPVRMVGIVTDLTEERALAESEERYRVTLQAIGVGVPDWDVRADAVHWDERLAQMCGWPQNGSPNGAWVLERVHPADRDPVRTAVQTALAEPRDVQVEARMRDADGRYRWLQLAARSQAGDSGRVERISGIVRDISDLRRVEEHRRRLARDLHDSVVQEIAVSATYADAALTVIAPTLPSRQRALLETLRDQIMRASDDMRSLIGTLRDPSQPGGGPPLAAMASELAADLEEHTGAAVDLHVGLPASEPLEAGASEAMEYVLREALSNVEKHAKASTVRVELTFADGAVRITVTDDGRGFEVGALDDDEGSLRARGNARAAGRSRRRSHCAQRPRGGDDARRGGPQRLRAPPPSGGTDVDRAAPYEGHSPRDTPALPLDRGRGVAFCSSLCEHAKRRWTGGGVLPKLPVQRAELTSGAAGRRDHFTRTGR